MKTKTYRTIEKRRKEKNRKRRNLNIVEHSIWKKRKKEQIFLVKWTVHHYIDWKKEEKKTEHFWTVIVILFWLVVKWNFLSLFEFKGDIFFSCSYYVI